MVSARTYRHIIHSTSFTNLPARFSSLLIRRPTILLKMHSFASVLIAAALATLITAAPLALPYNFLASRSFVREASVWPVYARTGSSTGQVGSAESQVESVPNGVRVRGVDSAIAGAVRSTRSEITQVHTRADPPSVASIFAFLSNEIQPYTVRLSTLTQHSYGSF